MIMPCSKSLLKVGLFLLAQSALAFNAVMEFEPNNSLEAAESIEFDREFDGNISSESDIDYYKFTVDQQLKLSIAL